MIARRDSIEWCEMMIEHSPLTDCKPMLAQIAEELRQLRAAVGRNAAPELLSALRMMVKPFALTSDETLRQYPDKPQPAAILAARAAIAKAEGRAP